MPNSTKVPPPQQASLQEIWGKKKETKVVAPKAESDAMEVDTPEEVKGPISIFRLLTRVLVLFSTNSRKF